MIKYNFKVEVPFLDKTNKLAEVKKDAVLVVTEERLKQLNDAKVGRVISAEYVEDKTPTKSTKGKNKKEEVVVEKPKKSDEVLLLEEIRDLLKKETSEKEEKV